MDVNSAGQIIMSSIIKIIKSYIVYNLTRSYPNNNIESYLKISVDPITLLNNFYIPTRKKRKKYSDNVYPVFPIEITITTNNQFIRNGLQEIINRIKHNRNLVYDLFNIPCFEILYLYIVNLIQNSTQTVLQTSRYEQRSGVFPKFHINHDYSNDDKTLHLKFYMIYYDKNIPDVHFLLGSIIITVDVVNTITYNMNDVPQNMIVTNIITPTLVYNDDVLNEAVVKYNKRTDVPNIKNTDMIKQYLNGKDTSSMFLAEIDIKNLCISKYNNFYSIYQKLFAPPNNSMTSHNFVKIMYTLLVKYLEPKQELNISTVGINPLNNFIENWKITSQTLLMFPISALSETHYDENSLDASDKQPPPVLDSYSPIYYTNLVSPDNMRDILSKTTDNPIEKINNIYYFKVLPLKKMPQSGGVVYDKDLFVKKIRNEFSPFALFTLNTDKIYKSTGSLFNFDKLKDKNIYLYKKNQVYRYNDIFIRDAICYSQAEEAIDTIEITHSFGPALEAFTEIDSTLLDTAGDCISVYETKYDTSLTLIDDSTLSNLINSFITTDSSSVVIKRYYNDDEDDSDGDEESKEGDDNAANTVTPKMIAASVRLNSILTTQISDKKPAGKGGRKHHKTKKYIKIKKNTHTIGKSILKNKKTTIKLKLTSKHTITNKRI